MKEKWYSIREAAAYLEIGEPTLYRWMRDRRITYRKVGDSTRFLQTDLDAVIEVHHAEKSAEKVRWQCPYCGSTDLLEGRLRSTGLLYFQLAKSKFWTLKDSAIRTEGLVCAHCGGILLFADRGKLDALRPAAVEEPQPDAESVGE